MNCINGASFTFSFCRTDLNPHPATESYLDHVYYHWSKHPFIRGGYSSPTAHAHGLRDELARPVEDRLFFAGEATSVTACATVHTAMETGFRAACEVCCHAKRVHTKWFLENLCKLRRQLQRERHQKKVSWAEIQCWRRRPPPPQNNHVIMKWLSSANFGEPNVSY